jgi:hypothetical protein
LEKGYSKEQVFANFPIQPNPAKQEAMKRFKHSDHRGHGEKRRERKEIFLLFEE